MNNYQAIAVFLGPSLSTSQARKILAADYYPPARKGDIYRIITSGLKAIILIDGIFHNAPSIWQRELLYAIEEGIQVFGASGMGALRAAELTSFGMIGRGTIFEWYRDGVIEGDDEVAFAYKSEEQGYIPLSEPLVNIRYNLLTAVEKNYLSSKQAELLIDYAKELYYPQRSYQKLFQSPVIQDLSLENRASLKHYLLDYNTDLKKIDAINVLKLCADLKNQPQPKPQVRFYSPSIDIQVQQLSMTGFVTSSGIVFGEEVWHRLQLSPQEQTKIQRKLAKQIFLLTWAKQNNVSYPQEELAVYIEQWQQKYGIVDLPQWLSSNGLTLLTYKETLAEYFLIDWLTKVGPNYFGIKWDYRTALKAELKLTGKLNTTKSENIWEQLSQRCFILEWAQQNGVACPPHQVETYLKKWEATKEIISPTEWLETANLNHDLYKQLLKERATETWIIDRGASYFGISYSFGAKLMRELQITGIASRLLAATINSYSLN